MSADRDVVSEKHKPNFKKQSQEFLGTEERMDPPPDFGYDWYKGSGKLKNKVVSLSQAPACFPAHVLNT